jgi:ATP-dependent DNA helicase DinG
VRNDRRMTPGHWELLKSRVDQIIGPRRDRKGLIHSTSFARGLELYDSSKFRDLMVLHREGEKIADVVEEFRARKDAAVLVSPSITTGFDFKDDEARYQIMLKVPFPPCITPVMKARQKQDPTYPMFMAATELVQAAGRIVRSEQDWGESFILDAHLGWFMGKYRSFHPWWFLESVKEIVAVPKAPVLKVA